MKCHDFSMHVIRSSSRAFWHPIHEASHLTWQGRKAYRGSRLAPPNSRGTVKRLVSVDVSNEDYWRARPWLDIFGLSNAWASAGRLKIRLSMHGIWGLFNQRVAAITGLNLVYFEIWDKVSVDRYAEIKNRNAIKSLYLKSLWFLTGYLRILDGLRANELQACFALHHWLANQIAFASI